MLAKCFGWVYTDTRTPHQCVRVSRLNIIVSSLSKLFIIMKLHLPPPFLAALLATFVVASYTYAEDISLNPLSSENGWVYSKRNDSKGSPTYSNGSITLADNWAQNLASWQQSGVLYDVGSTGEMTFSATLSETGTGGVLGLALVGSTQTIVLGAPKYNSQTNLWYAISDNVRADVFLAESSGWDNNRVVANVPSSDLKSLGTCVAGTPFTIDGTVKRTQTGTYSLTLKFNNVEVVSDLDLGYTMDLSRVAFYSDGADNVNATLSQLTFTGVSEYHVKDVTWNGQTSWNNRDQVWLDSAGNAVAFHQMDNVTFGTHAEGVGSTVTISEEVTAPTITVNDQYVFNLAENSILRGDITVNKDAGLALKGSGRFLGVLSGSGVLSFDGVDGLISSEANAIAVSELTITDATVATERFQSNGGTSIIKAETLVNIGKGGTLQLNGHDMLGWGGNSPEKIVLQSDDAEKLAVFDIQDSSSLTLKTALELNGNALVKGSSFNTYGTSIAVTGTNNEIASEFQARHNVTITVAKDGELLISGLIKNGNNDGEHNITKSGDGLLKISGTIDAGYTGTISVNAGGLSTKKYSSQANLQQLISYEADTKISTTGTGFILLNSGAYLLNVSDPVTISNKNYHVAGDFELNGYGNNVADASRSLIVQNGKSFTVDGNLYIATRGKLEINGGHVTAGTMSLGHTDNGAYQGYLAMSSGSLTSGTITLNNTHSNSIDITGGTVEFTTATALSRGTNTGSTINITGTSADAPVVLKATQAAWTLDGSGLTAAPTLGNIKVDAGNTHAITLKNVALSGSVVGNGKFTLGGAIASDDAVLDGALTLDNVTFSGDKVTLQEDARATVANMSDISSLLPQLTGTGTLVLASDAFIAGTSDSAKVYDFAGNIEVTGGVLKLGQLDGNQNLLNQLTLNDATIKLNGGGIRYYGGDSTLGSIAVQDNATIDVYATNGPYNNPKGTLTLESITVASGKTLTMSGQWAKNVNISEINGAGKLTIVGTTDDNYAISDISVGTLEVNKKTDDSGSPAVDVANALTQAMVLQGNGVINLNGGVKVSSGSLKATGNISVNIAAGTHSLAGLDMGDGGVSSAQVYLKENANLSFTNMWMSTTAALYLEEGATLATNNIKIAGLSSTDKATLKTSSKGEYSIEKSEYTISNAEVTVTSDANRTLANKLSDSQIVNAGGGELKLTHADNALSGIKAMAGNISFESLKNQTLESLYIAEGKTVNVGEATLSIQEAATTNGSKATNVTFGNGAKLQGNLVLQSGASVSLGSGVEIDGTLTLGYGMELTGAQLEAIENLKNNADERVALFSNVDALKLADAATFSTNSVAVDYTGAQDLSNFFSNVDNGVYLLEFDQNVVYATLIPEPATTTLSLLALAALAARRRRR